MAKRMKPLGSATVVILACFYLSLIDGFPGNRPKSAFVGAQGSLSRKPAKGAKDFSSRTFILKTVTRSIADEDDIIKQCNLGDEVLEGTNTGAECSGEELARGQFSMEIERAFDIDTYHVPDISKEIPSDIPKVPGERNILKEAMSAYVRSLQSRPLLTKTLTAGFVGMIGDFLAQIFEHKMSKGVRFVLDARRVMGMTFECVFLSAPLMHYAYDYLEYIIPIQSTETDEQKTLRGGGSTDLDKKRIRTQFVKKWASAMSHVLADIFVLGPFYVLFIMFGTSLFEGRIRSLQAELAATFMPTFKTSVLASLGFMPMQVVAFGVLPTQFRLLYINLQDILWSALVSFAAHKARH
jgi:hypothetical protein